MDELVARDFSEVAYFRVHRLVVDTYSLQHPDRYCGSAKSLAAHLAGLCWLLEHGGNRAVGTPVLGRWLDGVPSIAKPDMPVSRGRLTIGDVRTVDGPVAYAAAVDSWARSTWDAYSPLQPLARAWLQEAFARRRTARH